MKKDVLVIGAGVTGMLSAWYLHQRGLQVTVVDAAGEPAAGASHANAGQLSYSFVEPLAQPALFRRLFGLVFKPDDAVKIGFTSDPDFYRWGLSFLRNCAPGRARKHTHTLTELAIQSAALMQTFHHAFGDGYRHRRNGKIVLHRQRPSNAGQTDCTRPTANGFARVLERHQAVAVEPELERVQNNWHFATLADDDEVGDARSFCSSLQAHLADEGVTFMFNTRVENVSLQNDRPGIDLPGSRLSAEATLVCAGVRSPELVQALGIKWPIIGMAGYSLDLPEPAPFKRSVTVVDRRIVFSPLGQSLRIAGFADINVDDSAARIDALARVATETLAGIEIDRAIVEAGWRGLRPQTPDSLPVTGRTRIPGVYANTGHGMFGWTLGAATASSVAEQIAYDLGVGATPLSEVR